MELAGGLASRSSCLIRTHISGGCKGVVSFCCCCSILFSFFFKVLIQWDKSHNSSLIWPFSISTVSQEALAQTGVEQKVGMWETHEIGWQHFGGPVCAPDLWAQLEIPCCAQISRVSPGDSDVQCFRETVCLFTSRSGAQYFGSQFLTCKVEMVTTPTLPDCCRVGVRGGCKTSECLSLQWLCDHAASAWEAPFWKPRHRTPLSFWPQGHKGPLRRHTRASLRILLWSFSLGYTSLLSFP
jgi:hypothetical protein